MNKYELATARPSRTNFISLLAVALTCVAAALAISFAPASAQPAFADTNGTSTKLVESTTSPYVIDQYGLFDQSTYDELASKANTTSEQYGVGVYLLVVDNIGSMNVRQYAIQYYKSNNLGMGSSKSGILFLIAVDSRDYVTITYGDGVNAFTDWQIGEMEDDIVDELKDNHWVSACETYYDEAEYTLNFRAENGEPLDKNNAPLDPFERAIIIGIIILVGLALAGGIAGGICYANYKAMKTARIATSADNYIDRSSFVLLSQNDSFVRSVTTSSPRVQSSSSSGGGGGSSIGGGGFGGSSGGKF